MSFDIDGDVATLSEYVGEAPNSHLQPHQEIYSKFLDMVTESGRRLADMDVRKPGVQISVSGLLDNANQWVKPQWSVSAKLEPESVTYARLAQQQQDKRDAAARELE